MKNILYIHQYFRLPEHGGSTRSYWIAKAMIERGYNVTMLTSTQDGLLSKGLTVVDGIRVHALDVKYSQQMSVPRRVVSFIMFMFKSTMFSLRQKKVDLVYSTSTPLTVAIPALILKGVKKCRFIFEVRDLWPSVPIQMGAINNKILIAMLYWFERFVYIKADYIVALSPGMAEGVAKYGFGNKVSVIPNMAKTDVFRPMRLGDDIYGSFSLRRDSVKIVHFGAMGTANGLLSLIKAFEVIATCNRYELVLVGEGSEKKKLENYVKDKKIQNVHFMGNQSLHRTAEIVNCCHYSFVSFLDLPILYTNSPNKLFDSLSAGKPVIVNSAGWTKDLVEENNCGFYVDPKNPLALKEKLEFYRHRQDLTSIMSKNSLKLAKSTFDKSILCDKVLDVVGKSFI